ncbi:two-component sensor histidine kinase [Cohnella sp. CIP 111063]|jgi:Predicted signal transduction protein with a C-terminal ATPase domain|uniref:cache domain-containing sensor histidine kinase n=1 Tax=unclassified Cohnella TaxID=2636738 RepID=UPI000B8BC057|nr:MULTISPECIES: sensor histidine kinase [unclassified Cohnella]OXS53579.1 two-component sensor histidine kinase [Cohnella sp. CIP 111063]PRX61609.1 two-component system sensor histidine kinase YesM [Cohnella sp. SGD-V74]
MKTTFRSRILASYIFLIAIPLIVLGIVYYRTSLQVVTEQAQRNVYEIVKKNNAIMDTKLGIIEQNSLALFVDKDLFRIFSNLNPANEADIFEADRQVSAVLRKYFSLNEDVYAYQLWTSYFTFGQMLPQGDPTQSDVYRKAQQAGGKIVWYPTYDFVDMFEQPYLQNGKLDFRHLFSATRYLDFSYLDNTTLEKMDAGVERPVLAISLKLEALGSLYEESFPESSRYLVMNEEYKVVASSDPNKISQVYREQWLERLQQENSGTLRMTLDGEAVIVCFDRSTVTGWISVVWTPESALVSSLVPVIRTSSMLMAVILGIVAMALAYFIAGRITKPIKKLLGAMRSVGEGDFQTQIAVRTNDEFGILLQRFNRMNEQIRHLVTENYEIKLKEQEAEIQALSMQMNPHFLYNTLNVMNWTAIENGQKELSKMLVCLSNMLHYTSRKDWGAVHLSEEMEWMNNYFYIMSARFEDKFAIGYEIDPRLYEYKVPRLLFQPFVENAILHGFDQIETGGFIRIRGWIEEDARYYEIADNGRGMSEDTVKAILFRESSSVGIKNTIARIQLLYGGQYGITINSKPSSGTSVVITLPLKP